MMTLHERAGPGRNSKRNTAVMRQRPARPAWAAIDLSEAGGDDDGQARQHHFRYPRTQLSVAVTYGKNGPFMQHIPQHIELLVQAPATSVDLTGSAGHFPSAMRLAGASAPRPLMAFQKGCLEQSMRRDFTSALVMGVSLMLLRKVSGAVGGLVSAIALSSVASANGLHENRPYQFRSDNERQVALNRESVRLSFMTFDRGVGSTAGLGASQTGNTITISINGNGDNVIDVGQSNEGDQTVSDTTDDQIINN